MKNTSGASPVNQTLHLKIFKCFLIFLTFLNSSDLELYWRLSAGESAAIEEKEKSRVPLVSYIFTAVACTLQNLK